MRLGIMQPYFFPYIGYFQLMNAVDQWIVFDTPQYIRHGWVNRNRVLSHGENGWKYITVPIQKCSRNTPIHSVKIGDRDWQTELSRSFDYYAARKAPYLEQTVAFVERAIAGSFELLSDLLVATLRQTLQYLEIETPLRRFSEMDLQVGEIDHPGQWALKISREVGASVYINPPGGREIFDREEFTRETIDLRFLEPKLEEYDQGRKDFVAGLSIIDCLMFNGSDKVRQMAKEFRVHE